MTLVLNNASAHAILQRKDLDMKRFLEMPARPHEPVTGLKGDRKHGRYGLQQRLLSACSLSPG
jgi:hypothetical protein